MKLAAIDYIQAKTIYANTIARRALATKRHLRCELAPTTVAGYEQMADSQLATTL